MKSVWQMCNVYKRAQDVSSQKLSLSGTRFLFANRLYQLIYQSFFFTSTRYLQALCEWAILRHTYYTYTSDSHHYIHILNREPLSCDLSMPHHPHILLRLFSLHFVPLFVLLRGLVVVESFVASRL